MDVIITLPTNLIQLIKDGKKTIELRKNRPLFFNPEEDVIHICQKGTAKVVGYLKIDAVKSTRNKYGILTGWAKDIAVPVKWIENYIRNAKDLYGYFIGSYTEFDKPLSLRENFKVYRAPQSFAYTTEYVR